MKEGEEIVLVGGQMKEKPIAKFRRGGGIDDVYITLLW